LKNGTLAFGTLVQAKSREVLPVQPVDATPPDINLFSKGGVHDAETMEAVFGPAGRYVGLT
jgi:hypothetical protein